MTELCLCCCSISFLLLQLFVTSFVVLQVRELVDKATNIVMNYTETEAKVREATNDDPWGPSGRQTLVMIASIYCFEFLYL